MDTLKNIGISVAVSLVVVVTGLLVFGGNTTVVREVKEQLGAVGAPDIISPYIRFGGVPLYAARTESLNSATTTVCALQAPAATSTLLSAMLYLDNSSTTASTITVARATTAFATTTFLGSASVSANARATVAVQATSTGGSVASGYVFPPNTYLVVGMQGGVGTFSPSGICQATWQGL